MISTDEVERIREDFKKVHGSAPTADEIAKIIVSRSKRSVDVGDVDDALDRLRMARDME